MLLERVVWGKVLRGEKVGEMPMMELVADRDGERVEVAEKA
jgi:hypothetical protein